MHLLFYRPKSNITVIDGLRSLSILIVVFSHLIIFLELFYPNSQEFSYKLPFALRLLLSGGVWGVNIFFVISGFLIGRILLVEYKKTQNIRIGNFYARRFLRLMPVYWLGLLLGVVLGFPNVQYIWANLIYVVNFLKREHIFLGWTWSISVEEQFYFIFPVSIIFFFSFKLFREHAKTWLLLIFLGAITLNYFLVFYFNLKIPPTDLNSAEMFRFTLILYVKPYTCFVTIFAGVVIAYLECISKNKATFIALFRTYNLHHVAIILAIAFIFFVFFIGDGVAPFSVNPGQWVLPLLQPLFAASIAYLIFYIHNYDSVISRLLNKFLSLKIFYIIAQLSYSTYIFHLLIILPIYHILITAFPYLSYQQLLAIGAPISLFCIFLVSTASYLFLERPFMNLRK